jgi:hypothetical protein
MNKSVLIISATLLGCAGLASFFARDAQQERARAQSLSVRLAELEPVEKARDPRAHDRAVSSQISAPIEQAIPSADAAPVQPHASSPPKLVRDYPGTLRSRRQVEQLQSALADGTPLQEYQIRALIAAIDRVHRDLERADEKADVRATKPPVQSSAAVNARIIEAAQDILFESQLERFMELLNRDRETRQDAD